MLRNKQILSYKLTYVEKKSNLMREYLRSPCMTNPASRLYLEGKAFSLCETTAKRNLMNDARVTGTLIPFPYHSIPISTCQKINGKKSTIKRETETAPKR